MIFKAILSNRTAPEYGHIKGVYKLHEMIAKGRISNYPINVSNVSP